MALQIFWDTTLDGDYWDYTISCLSEPYRIKKKKANIFIRLKWFILILVWKFKNRKWKNHRKKNRALDRYKEKLMK